MATSIFSLERSRLRDAWSISKSTTARAASWSTFKQWDSRASPLSAPPWTRHTGCPFRDSGADLFLTLSGSWSGPPSLVDLNVPLAVPFRCLLVMLFCGLSSVPEPAWRTRTMNRAAAEPPRSWAPNSAKPDRRSSAESYALALLGCERDAHDDIVVCQIRRAIGGLPGW